MTAGISWVRGVADGSPDVWNVQPERKSRELRLQALEIVEAVTRERSRLADVLHDELQQLLVAAKMTVDSIGNGKLSPEEVAIKAVDTAALLKQAITLGRSLTSDLRSLESHGNNLAPAIQWFARQVKLRFGVNVSASLAPDPGPADPRVKSFVYWAVRELVFNAVKHADTPEVRVMTAVREPDLFHVRIEDDGVGLDPTILEQKHGESSGLASIAARTLALRGEMHIESAPGRGTRVCLDVPSR